MRSLLGLLFLLASLSDAAFAQSAPVGKKAPSDPEIIVKGIPTGPFPTKIDTRTGQVQESVEAGQATADAQLFSHCITAREGAELQGVIDGIPNGNDRTNALDRLIRTHRPCYPNYVSEPPQAAPYYGVCNPRGHFEPVMSQPNAGPSHIVETRLVFAICQAFYDRGALVERALALYAPDLNFTTQQLFDPAVLSRFHAHEDRFNRTRAPGERIFAEVAACLVAFHPDLALAYPKANANQATRLRAMMIGTSPQCVGSAKNVSVDPSQFRIFLADALYSWAIALRGTDSLIPGGSGASGN